ncbi:MAG: hypothetical protein HOY71_44365 [Nonomuraea sp.]|nr:hypothetical protein [Nonomuraea sp.]
MRRYVDLDDYYRNALCQGLAYHQDSGRGFVACDVLRIRREHAFPGPRCRSG